MQRYYEDHPSAFQWSLWQQVCAREREREVWGGCIGALTGALIGLVYTHRKHTTRTQVIGGVIGLICCCVLVYSEVNAMLLTRDLDALKAAELLSAPKSIELSQRELVSMENQKKWLCVDVCVSVCFDCIISGKAL
jgi:hypothetical protein